MPEIREVHVHAASVGASAAGAVRTPGDLRGPAGRLEALYTPGSSGAPYAVVVSHPHPLFGGTMHNKVVYHAAKAFQHYGLPVLRYNFRGAGASEGAHDAGEGEQQDLAAALDWLTRETGLPILAAGFSFGAWVTLRTCCPGSFPSRLPDAGVCVGPGGGRAEGIVALGLPIQAGDRGYSYEFLAGCTLPKLFISGSADEFGPVPQVESVFSHAAPPAKLVWIDGADHFFQGAPGGLQQMQAAIHAWLEARFLPRAAAPVTEPVPEPFAKEVR
jgi:alpha/beta superfamily hydrolase